MNKTQISLALLLASATSGACVRRVYVTPRAYQPVYVEQQPQVVVQQPPPEVQPQPVYVGQVQQQEVQPPPPEVQQEVQPPPPAVQASVVVAPPPPAVQASVVVAPPPAAAPQPTVYVQEERREGWVPPHRRHRRHVIIVR